MKNKITLLTAVLMTLSLAACSSPGSTDTAPAAPTSAAPSATAPTDAVPTGPVTIKFANYALLEDATKDYWANIKTGFEAKYPNITIDYVTAPYGEVTQQVINQGAAGDKVDLMLGDTDWTPVLEDTGLLTPVDTVMPQSYLDQFYPNVLDAHKVNGKLYSLPMFYSPFLLFYNKDILAQAGYNAPPTTYDEMLAMADKINGMKTADGNKIYPYGQTTASVAVSGSALTSMVYNFGGDVLTSDGKLNIDNDGFKQAFQTLQTLDKKGYNPQNAKLKDLRNLFALGQLAMYTDTSWGFAGVKAINPDATKYVAAALPLAGGSGTGQAVLQAHMLMFMDNGDANRTAATRLLVEYISAPEVLSQEMLNINIAFPAIKSMAGTVSPILSGVNPVDRIKPTVFIPQMSDFYLSLCTMAQAVTVGGEDLATATQAFKTTAQGILG